MNPHPYPITTAFQPNPLVNIKSFFSWNIDGGGRSLIIHFIVNGNPHNPMFPMYELFSNVLNYEPWGMGPVSRFCERFKISKNVRLVNCIGIEPLSIFEEMSKDSSTDKFANDDGI